MWQASAVGARNSVLRDAILHEPRKEQTARKLCSDFDTIYEYTLGIDNVDSTVNFAGICTGVSVYHKR